MSKGYHLITNVYSLTSQSHSFLFFLLCFGSPSIHPHLCLSASIYLLPHPHSLPPSLSPPPLSFSLFIHPTHDLKVFPIIILLLELTYVVCEELQLHPELLCCSGTVCICEIGMYIHRYGTFYNSILFTHSNSYARYQ